MTLNPFSAASVRLQKTGNHLGQVKTCLELGPHQHLKAHEVVSTLVDTVSLWAGIGAWAPKRKA